MAVYLGGLLYMECQCLNWLQRCLQYDLEILLPYLALWIRTSQPVLFMEQEIVTLADPLVTLLFVFVGVVLCMFLFMFMLCSFGLYYCSIFVLLFFCIWTVPYIFGLGYSTFVEHTNSIVPLQIQFFFLQIQVFSLYIMILLHFDGLIQITGNTIFWNNHLVNIHSWISVSQWLQFTENKGIKVMTRVHMVFQSWWPCLFLWVKHGSFIY